MSLSKTSLKTMPSKCKETWEVFLLWKMGLLTSADDLQELVTPSKRLVKFMSETQRKKQINLFLDA